MSKKKCWYCGSKEIVYDARGTRCPKCGATDNELPKLGPPALEGTATKLAHKRGGHAPLSLSPNKRILRQVAKAREKAK